MVVDEGILLGGTFMVSKPLNCITDDDGSQGWPALGGAGWSLAVLPMKNKIAGKNIPIFDFGDVDSQTSGPDLSLNIDQTNPSHNDQKSGFLLINKMGSLFNSNSGFYISPKSSKITTPERCVCS